MDVGEKKMWKRQTRRDVLRSVIGLSALGFVGPFWRPATTRAATPARARPDATRTAEDLAALIESHGRYSFAADVTPDPADYADLFVDDGAFIGLVNRGGSEGGIRGREAILSFSRRAKGREGKNVAWFGHHNQASNVIFALDGDTALTRTYLLATLVAGANAPTLGVASEYEDRMVRTPDGWRIFERRAGLLPTLSPDVFGAPFPGRADEEDPMSFSGFDRMEIVDLVGRWSHAADGDERKALDRVMTNDAVLEIVERTGPPKRFEGLDAIWAHLGGGSVRDREIRRHVRNTVIVDAEDGRATATSYYMISAGDRPPKLALVATGLYTDTVVRTKAGWRISHRKIEPDGTGGESPRG
jgi:hypothetical protein